MADLTAQELIQRVLAKTGAGNRPQTADHVSAGDPSQTVTGIAVTAMASLDALKAAAAKKLNLVFTYDPAFWSTADELAHLPGNSLFAEKRAVIRDHNLVLFNLHDHWQGRMPDGIAEGMAAALGWTPEPGDPNLFKRPPGPLLALAQELGSKLDDKTLRVVGDPKLPVTTIAASFGRAQQLPGIALANGPVDVVICGYTPEWELVEYIQDMIAAGLKKALILLGENASVGAGMKHGADWIGSFTPEVPVEFLPLAEPYWNP